jgi:broad specificity phosphatase PhoE
LLLVRHSAPLLDPNVPSEQWGLSEDGRARCVALVERLTPSSPRVLVASPERKARETAELIAPALGLRVELDDRLRETARRSVGWLTRDELAARIGELFARPTEIAFGEESAAAALARFEAAVGDLPAASIVVSHATIISLYVAARTGCDGYALWRGLAMPDVVAV